MDSVRERSIRTAANDFLVDFWNHRDSHWAIPPTSWTQFLPLDLDRCVQLLGFCLEEPEQIHDDASSVSVHGLPFETAGILDREGRRIVIAQKFRKEYRRFTLAHEIGHAVLHPAVRHHRDRPLTGGERANRVTRADEEQEADLFAAELLMPTCVTTEIFTAIYEHPVRAHEVDEELLFWLRSGTGEQISFEALRGGGPERLSLLIARNRCYRNRHFASLCEIFAVSATAMAIQLTDLRLVH